MEYIEQSLSEKKKAYMESIRAFKKNETVDNLTDCMIKGNEYFNDAEKIVSSSSLKGGHSNGIWISDLAESCEEILCSYIKHISFILSHNKLLNDSYKKPSKNACTNMQRMVKLHCQNDISDALRAEFVNAGLPTRGFDVKASSDKVSMEKILPVIVGIIFILISFFSALFIRDPSQTQFFVIRGLFSLGCAAAGSCIPGWLNVEIHGYIKAGGAIALVLIFWFFNPPAFIMS